MHHRIHLYGDIANKYGSIHSFDIKSAPEAARALAANYKGFRSDFINGNYQVLVGKDNNTTELDEDTLDFCLGNAHDVHFIPVVAGSKRGGGIKAIAGIALLTVATWGAASAVGAGVGLGAGFGATAVTGLGTGITWGNIASLGLSLAFTGVSQLLTPAPKVSDYGVRETPDQRASFIFNGAVNRGAEGSCVPIVYGECVVGSIVLSAGISTEKLL